MAKIQPKAHPLYWAVLLLSGVTFGASFSLFKIATGAGNDPLGLAFWYAALSAVLLAPLSMQTEGRWRWLNRSALNFCFIWGLFSTTLPSVFFFYAARELPAGIIALAIALVPIATFAGAIWLKHDQPSLKRCIGIGLGAVAALLVVLPETSLPERGDVVWMLLPFGVVLCYAGEHLYYALKAPAHAPPQGLLNVMFVGAALTLLPITLMTSTFHVPDFPPNKADLALLGVAVVTVLDYFLFMFLMARAGPVFTSQAAYVVTLAGVGWGMLLFGESHSIWIWTALVVALLGVTLVQPK
ncbi:MAG: DMT family transporter [Litoreibacter sp.]|nr:DMT family transporter [Litoreibacter sp.]